MESLPEPNVHEFIYKMRGPSSHFGKEHLHFSLHFVHTLVISSGTTFLPVGIMMHHMIRADRESTQIHLGIRHIPNTHTCTPRTHTKYIPMYTTSLSLSCCSNITAIQGHIVNRSVFNTYNAVVLYSAQVTAPKGVSCLYSNCVYYCFLLYFQSLLVVCISSIVFFIFLFSRWTCAHATTWWLMRDRVCGEGITQK